MNPICTLGLQESQWITLRRLSKQSLKLSKYDDLLLRLMHRQASLFSAVQDACKESLLQVDTSESLLCHVWSERITSVALGSSHSNTPDSVEDLSSQSTCQVTETSFQFAASGRSLSPLVFRNHCPRLRERYLDKFFLLNEGMQLLADTGRRRNWGENLVQPP